MKVSDNTWEVLSDHACQLGECPIWDAENERIFWVDILQHEVHCLNIYTDVHKVLNIGQAISAIALLKRDPGQLVAVLRDGFAFIDIDDGSRQWIAHTEAEISKNRFNDGKCDPAGRFWAGTMEKSGKVGAGNVYALEHDLSVGLKIRGVTISNGMAWSPDCTYFYYIDTATHKVSAYDYDIISGNIRNRKIIIDIPPDQGRPDGMTIDSEGMLWIALWGGCKVTRWNPHTGKLIGTVSLPVARITSCTFGGNNLEDMYVTSAKVGLTEKELEAQPLAGCVFLIKDCGAKGVPGYKFGD